MQPFITASFICAFAMTCFAAPLEERAVPIPGAFFAHDVVPPTSNIDNNGVSVPGTSTVANAVPPNTHVSARAGPLPGVWVPVDN
ncbi:unnamed protein product [Peniophora sp. CBMAI 1063]|nr:unnamed protein product [Peniophora sp. CBMAI 1063]